MRCTQCEFDKYCKLKEIASDLIGCDGHSKERAPSENEVKCICCKEWVKKKECFKNSNNNTYVCFRCF